MIPGNQSITPIIPSLYGHATKFFDQEKLDKCTGGFNNLGLELLEAFVDVTPSLLDEFRLSLQEGNARRTGKIIQKLKFSAGLFCSDLLFQEIVELETSTIQIATPEYSSRATRLMANIEWLMLEVKPSAFQ
jgi:hypothetical protein